MEMSESDFRAFVTQHLAAMRAEMAANTEQTKETGEAMKGLIEVFQIMQGGIRFLGVLGKIAKFLTPFVALAGAVWALMHGKWPDRL